MQSLHFPEGEMYHYWTGEQREIGGCPRTKNLCRSPKNGSLSSPRSWSSVPGVRASALNWGKSDKTSHHQMRVRDSKDFKSHIQVLSEDTAIFPICLWNIPIENATAHPFTAPVCVTLFASFHSQTSNTIRPSSSIATWAKKVLLIRWPCIQIPLFLLPAASSAYFTSFPADKTSFTSLRIQPDIWQAHLEKIGNIINFLEASLGECWWFPVQWL